MLNRFTVDIEYGVVRTEKNRLNYLNSLKQKLENIKKVRAQIKKDLELTLNPATKVWLQKKLDKYNRVIVDMEFSVKLAQRDYDNKVRENEEGTKLVQYMLNRCR